MSNHKNNVVVLDNIDLGVRDVKNNSLDKNQLVYYNDICPLNEKKEWVKDEFTIRCNRCACEFNMFTRKHHCRYCGKIFCHKCANYWINIPRIIRNRYIHSSKKKERVCDFCYNKIVNINNTIELYILVGLLPLDLISISNCRVLNKKWKKAYDYYFSTVKYIQKKSVSKISYSNIEWNIIWCNRFVYQGHISWTVNLIKYIDFFNIDNEDEITNILYGDKFHKCESLSCNDNCKKSLTLIEAINCINHNIKNSICEKFILDIFWQADLSEYLLFFPFIMKMLSPDKINLIDYVLSISCHNYQIANQLFWYLTFLVNHQDIDNIDFYQDLRFRFIDKIQPETKNHLQNSYYFIEYLNKLNCQQEFPTLIKSYLDTHKKNTKVNINCSLNPDKFILDIDIENVIVKGSYLKPIIIPFIDNKGETYKVMLKRDDLRKDYIVMNIIKYIDKIIKEEENIDLHITTYEILPVSKDFGLIEIVEDAETIYSINKKSKFSILNYILENNSDYSVDQIRDRFTKSCVGYCIISYLLGIGDRHLENIMIKKTGEIFHIDFGFILGYDPKLLSPEIRLTSEMVDAMGGKNSKYYTQFKELWQKCVLRLRNHTEEIKLLLYCLVSEQVEIDKNIDIPYIDKFIENKFMIGQHFNEVKLYLIKKIDNSSKIYSDRLIDFCHNTVTGDSQTFTSQAMNYGNSMYSYLTNW